MLRTVLLLVFGILVIQGCGNVILPHAPKTIVTIRIIPPATNEGGISLLTDLAGYQVYYGRASGDYSHMISFSPQGTTFPVEILENGTWYFIVTAIDYSGNESKPSNEMNISLII